MREYKIFESLMGEDLAASMGRISFKQIPNNPSGITHQVEADVLIPGIILDATKRTALVTQHLSYFTEVAQNLENQAASLVRGISIPTDMSIKIHSALYQVLERIYRGNAPYSAYIVKDVVEPKTTSTPIRAVRVRLSLGITNDGKEKASLFWIVTTEVVRNSQLDPELTKERTVEMLFK